MSNQSIRIDTILDLEKWHDLQESLAEVTKLAILTVDFKGQPIAAHSRCCTFCRLVRENPELLKRCQKCDSRGGLEAVRSNAPFLYLCHFNIVDIAIPISVDDRYIGAVMAGQVRIKDQHLYPELELIHHSPTSQKIYSESRMLQAAYERIPELEFSDINNAANMLFQLCNYIIEEAKHKVFHSSSKMEQNDVENNDTHSNVSTKVSHPQLISALKHINSTENRDLSLKEAANLCFLSQSYFSRLFLKETGETYTNYIQRIKIKRAKELLEKTILSVSRISDELSFSNPSYFIRVFSKYEQLTPAAYRDSYRKVKKLHE